MASLEEVELFANYVEIVQVLRMDIGKKPQQLGYVHMRTPMLQRPSRDLQRARLRTVVLPSTSHRATTRLTAEDGRSCRFSCRVLPGVRVQVKRQGKLPCSHSRATVTRQCILPSDRQGCMVRLRHQGHERQAPLSQIQQRTLAKTRPLMTTTT